MGENELDLGFQPTLNLGGENGKEDGNKPEEDVTHLNGNDKTNPQDITGKDGNNGQDDNKNDNKDGQQGGEEKKTDDAQHSSTGGL